MGKIRLALIGQNISHSKSPSLYRALFQEEIQYDLIDIQSADLLPPVDDLARVYDGVNITAPYKSAYFNADYVQKEVAFLKAVNCLSFRKEELRMTNTDYYAVREILTSHRERLKEAKVLILGNGVMAQMTESILQEMSCDYSRLCRSDDGDLNEVDYFRFVSTSQKKLFIINACAREFIFKAKLPTASTFWDYNYELPQHKSLSKCCTYIDGYELLELQARYAKKFWKFDARV